MSEVLLVVIAGVFSVLPTMIMVRGARSARRDSFLAELTMVKARNERDQEAHREKARCNREATYKEFVTAFNTCATYWALRLIGGKPKRSASPI